MLDPLTTGSSLAEASLGIKRSLLSDFEYRKMTMFFRLG
jgi:hypothetical protein